MLACLVAAFLAAQPEMLHVNLTGVPFATALQATVAQGLIHRHTQQPTVYLSGIGPYPGMRGIEWLPGKGRSAYSPGNPNCSVCDGLESKWLKSISTIGQLPVQTSSIAKLMEMVRPLLKGKIKYDEKERHSLGPVVTLSGLDDCLPVTASNDPFEKDPTLTTLFDASGMWSDALAATLYTAHNLLHRTNTSTMAVQAPTCLPFLADAIVDWRLGE
jgi:hypothetical protein